MDMKTNKIISFVIISSVLIVGLWSGTTYWFGIKAEEYFEKVFQNASHLQGIKLVSASYHRGFTRSEAVTVLEVQEPSTILAKNKSISFTLTHEIIHGPFSIGELPDGTWQLKPLLAAIQTSPTLKSEIRHSFAELFDQIPEMASTRNYTVIHFDGSAESHLRIPAFRHSFDATDKILVDWKGLDFEVKFNSELTWFNGSLSVPGFAIVDENQDARLDGMKSGFDFRENEEGLLLGEASFDMDRAEFYDKKDHKSQRLVMEGFRLHTASESAESAIHSFLSINIALLRSKDLECGPAVFRMAVRNLDAPSLVRLQEILGHSSSDKDTTRIFSTLKEVLPNLLRRSPEIEVSQLEIKTFDGNLTARIKIGFDGKLTPPVPNLLMLANALEANLDLKVDEKLLHRGASFLSEADTPLPEKKTGKVKPGENRDAASAAEVERQLSELLARRFIVKENGTYRTTASYKAGQLVLNGQVLSFQDFMR